MDSNCSEFSFTGFQVHVLFHPNNPLSITAKDWLKTNFCDMFNVTPCEIQQNGNESSLHIFEDLGFYVPIPEFDSVISWVLQNRLGRLGGGYDLDLLVVPFVADNCISSYEFSMFAGKRYPFNINQLLNSGSSKTFLTSNSLSIPSINYSDSNSDSNSDSDLDNNDWAYTCSSDNTCYEPYANNTTCSSSSLIQSYHLHLFYVNNNPNSVDAINEFAELITEKFEIPSEFCIDSDGHEQSHDSICWLAGPSGVETEYPQESTKSSFVTGTKSLYIPIYNLTDVVCWVLEYHTKNYLVEDIDFLLHPNCGCNYADHQDFSLHAGQFWPNNMFGIEKEADWTETTYPSLDFYSDAYPIPDEENCGSSPFENYYLFVMYDLLEENSVDLKNKFIDNILKEFCNSQIQFIGDFPYAFLSESKPFSTSEVQFQITASAFDQVIPWVMTYRVFSDSSELDILITPVSDCSYIDLIKRSLFGGKKWPLNEYPLVFSETEPTKNQNFQEYSKNQKSNCNEQSYQPFENYIVYAVHASNNYWASISFNTFLDDFASTFDLVRNTCGSLYPNSEPDYGSLCMMGEVSQPYLNESDPFTESQAGIFVPAMNFTTIVSWAMDHRGSQAIGYDIDLLIVPLSGNSTKDYTIWSLKSGVDWRLNTAAFEK